MRIHSRFCFGQMSEADNMLGGSLRGKAGKTERPGRIVNERALGFDRLAKWYSAFLKDIQRGARCGSTLADCG